MNSEQRITEAMTQVGIKAAKTAILAVREIEIPVNITGTKPTVTETGGLVLKQPKLNRNLQIST